MYLMSWSSFVIVIMAYTFQFFFFELCILFCAHYLFVYLFDGIKKEKSVYFINEPLLIQSYMSVLRMYRVPIYFGKIYSMLHAHTTVHGMTRNGHS